MTWLLCHVRVYLCILWGPLADGRRSQHFENNVKCTRDPMGHIAHLSRKTYLWTSLSFVILACLRQKIKSQQLSNLYFTLKWSMYMYFHYFTSISLCRKAWLYILTKLDFLLPKTALSQVSLKFALWFLGGWKRETYMHRHTN